LWGPGAAVGSVSDLSRLAGVTFSAAHRELDAMRAAGLAAVERVGSELVHRADTTHPRAELLRQLANHDVGLDKRKQARRRERVRAWLANSGAPLGSPELKGTVPPVEEVVVEALWLSHLDATVTRVLPLVLWRQRDRLDLVRLGHAAARRDEEQALGFFLELAGQLGGERRLVEAARSLHDKRRKKHRMFFSGPHGPRALAATHRNTPKEALRWGYLMNMGLDSFRSTFDKFAGAR